MGCAEMVLPAFRLRLAFLHLLRLAPLEVAQLACLLAGSDSTTSSRSASPRICKKLLRVAPGRNNHSGEKG